MDSQSIQVWIDDGDEIKMYDSYNGKYYPSLHHAGTIEHDTRFVEIQENIFLKHLMIGDRQVITDSLK